MIEQLVANLKLCEGGWRLEVEVVGFVLRAVYSVLQDRSKDIPGRINHELRNGTQQWDRIFQHKKLLLYLLATGVSPATVAVALAILET